MHTENIPAIPTMGIYLRQTVAHLLKEAYMTITQTFPRQKLKIIMWLSNGNCMIKVHKLKSYTVQKWSAVLRNFKILLSGRGLLQMHTAWFHLRTSEGRQNLREKDFYLEGDQNNFQSNRYACYLDHFRYYIGIIQIVCLSVYVVCQNSLWNCIF